ncbi:MAG: type II toxin-antitoxin system YoeB family toxin [Propionibacteriaceae bacterium]|nr:type II toxin-antitoxin system YoeB family toxin [Propionibacteriaceae bacterium]
MWCPVSFYATLKRLNRLIEDALRTPTCGIVKPEPLKYNLGVDRRP